MFPQKHIDGFEKYWQQRKPGIHTAVHYASDAGIFFKWAIDLSPLTITVHDVDCFMEWQQNMDVHPQQFEADRLLRACSTIIWPKLVKPPSRKRMIFL